MRVFLSFIILFISFVSITQSQGFYSINTINTLEITFEEENWDYLLDQLVSEGNDERMIASISINGEEFDSVGVRYKGNSSYDSNQIKNPFNIKLDYIIDDQLIDNYGTLKLSNAFKDPSFIREALSYEIARKYMPASQSNYCNVYVNGVHLGLYTSNQSVDKYFMRSHFHSDENARIKGEISDVPPSEMGGVWEYIDYDSSSYFEKYTLKSDYGWNDLIHFVDTLNNYNSSVDYVLNTDRHLWFIAFSNLLVNLDGPINNPQNYYIYKDDAGRFNPIPWDLNMSFGGFTYLQTDGPLNSFEMQELDPFVNLNESEFPVISEILNDETYRKMYVAHLKTIINENFSEGQYETRAIEIQDIISSDVEDDENKFYSDADFINNIDNSIGGGPMSVIGITQLMDARVEYFESLSEFQTTAPEISNVENSPENAEANSLVWFSAEVSEVNEVYLAHRANNYGIFEKILMYDDGNHEDGNAGDGVYGVSLNVGSTDLSYYIYAENEDAVTFSPARAEYEFYSISITGDLVINEFMADNENTIADQDGEYDDWIEFFNNSNEDINLAGYYLSDDGGEVDKWPFPDTSISSGSYLIVWADDDEDQNGLHTNFKLSASGEQIIISDSNLIIKDSYGFLEQKEDTSTGRFENGIGDFMEMLPTFESQNTHLLTQIEEVENSDNPTFKLKQNYPNPFDQRTTIEFSLEEDAKVSLNIYNFNGSLIKTLVSTYLPEGEHSYSWNAENMASGLYFYSIDVDGYTGMKKMIIR